MSREDKRIVINEQRNVHVITDQPRSNHTGGQTGELTEIRIMK